MAMQLTDLFRGYKLFEEMILLLISKLHQKLKKTHSHIHENQTRANFCLVKENNYTALCIKV